MMVKTMMRQAMMEWAMMGRGTLFAEARACLECGRASWARSDFIVIQTRMPNMHDAIRLPDYALQSRKKSGTCSRQR